MGITAIKFAPDLNFLLQQFQTACVIESSIVLICSLLQISRMTSHPCVHVAVCGCERVRHLNMGGVDSGSDQSLYSGSPVLVPTLMFAFMSL